MCLNELMAALLDHTPLDVMASYVGILPIRV